MAFVCALSGFGGIWGDGDDHGEQCPSLTTMIPGCDMYPRVSPCIVHRAQLTRVVGEAQSHEDFFKDQNRSRNSQSPLHVHLPIAVD